MAKAGAFDKLPNEIPAALPRSFSGVAHSDWLPLLGRLWDVGLITFRPLHEVRAHQGRPLAAQLFG
eukprot:9806358-Lingulodinium_polyedra.AAC.1